MQIRLPVVFPALLALLLVACSAARGAPIPLKEGRQLGEARFPPGDTPRGGNGQPVDGIEALGREMLETHFHSHLALFYEGKQVAVPPGIGILRDGSAIYWVHTHDASGIIHVESPAGRRYTLGNFFDIWGEPLEKTNVAGLRGRVQAYVDGKPYHGALRDIALGAHTQITLVVGTPAVQPPVYAFPHGL